MSRFRYWVLCERTAGAKGRKIKVWSLWCGKNRPEFDPHDELFEPDRERWEDDATTFEENATCQMRIPDSIGRKIAPKVGDCVEVTLSGPKPLKSKKRRETGS